MASLLMTVGCTVACCATLGAFETAIDGFGGVGGGSADALADAVLDASVVVVEELCELELINDDFVVAAVVEG